MSKFTFEQNTWILDELQCPVCTDYMHPPIHQCCRGHSICEHCYGKLEKCPACRLPMTSARCYVLEQLHSKLYFPCKFKDDGCTLVCSGALIKKHEATCVYANQLCPLRVINNCKWKGQIKDIVKHCKTNHPLNVYLTNKQILSCKGFVNNSQGKNSFYIMFKTYDHLFKCVWHIDYQSQIMKWCVFFVGPRELAVKYDYQIEFEKKKSFEKVTMRANCEPLDLEGDSVCYLLSHYDVAKRFCNNGDLIYTVKIFEKC